MRHASLALFFLFVHLLWFSQISCHEQAKTSAASGTGSVAEGLEMGNKEARLVPDTGQAGPKVTFDEVVYDFGEVAARRKYTGEFKFRNTGNETLRITDVKKCCGAVVELDKEELAPGEIGVLKVEYLSGPNASVTRRRLYVSSNDKANPRVELTIMAKVVPKVTCEPRRLELVLKDENAGCPDITLTSVDKQPFSVTAFRSTGDSIAVDVDPSVEASQFVLKPKIDLEKLQNRSVGFISIDLTHPDCKKLTLSFSTLLRFEFKPRSIMVFNREPGRPTVKKISLVSNYNEDFEVESTSSEKGLASVLNQRKTGKGYEFDVEIAAPPPDETGRFSDILYLHLKGGQKLSIACYGRYMSE